MAQSGAIPFLQTFARCAFSEEIRTALKDCDVKVKIEKLNRTMHLELHCAESPKPEVIEAVKEILGAAFGLNGVCVTVVVSACCLEDEGTKNAEMPTQVIQTDGGTDVQDDPFRRTEAIREAALKQASVRPAGVWPEKKTKEKTIYGKITRKNTTPIGELSLDMGTVVIEGDVFNVEHKELPKRKAWVVSFDVTDYTGSIRVNRFMEQSEAKPIVDGVKMGKGGGPRLRIQGTLAMSRYEGEMVLEPVGIVEGKKELRKDEAPEGEKRVELHLHTRMSAMDATTDAAAAVKRAISWGHSAIAITDHGVLSAFPDAWHAGDGKIKIIYGVEAYFQNDVDERVAVHGPCGTWRLDGEFIAFDLETTGLNKKQDRIIEIGAVRVRNGQVVDKFSSFADPGHRLSGITVNLTGITDEMVHGAPAPHEAVRAFLDWAGETPLVAHNAEFDIGFVRETCQRNGWEFAPLWIDTLTLAQYLCPELSNHRLDTVAEHLELPPFQHHRAFDDADVCAQIFCHLAAYMKAEGVSTAEEINPLLATKKRGGKKGRRSNNHLILLAKNQLGLRNLCKLVSLSHLEHFSQFPVMPKSIVNANREGLIIGSACEAGEFFKAIVAGKDDEELLRIASWYDYLEIQPLSNNAYMLRPDKDGKKIAKDMDELRRFNRKVIEIADRLGKPVCATGDVHFMDKEDEIYRHILLAAKEFPDADSDNPLYFRTTDEMLEEFSYLGEETARRVVIHDPQAIANRCERLDPLPKGLFTPKLEDSEGELKRLVWGKAHELYGENPPDIVVDRLNTELGDIIGCHYDVIYMSAQKLVQNSLEHGYLVGSRGSVGSSLVAFMSGITEVNSLPAHYRCPKCKHADFEYGAAHGYGCGADMPDAECPVCGTKYAKDGFNIPFETFLGFGGDKVPDIDLNFSGEYQANAHRYTFELFGRDHVFRAGTIATVAEKTAYGYVLKYLEGKGKTVSKAEELRLARGCVGVRRTTGQHPGGMVVVPQDKEIYDFCPVQHPADDKDSDIITTHFEYHSMESNLLKLDILGHDDPSMLRMLEDITDQQVNVREIPLDDPGTMSLFSSSAVLGYEDDPLLGPTGATAVPEFGTSFVRQMLEDTTPDRFDLLVRLSGFSHGTDVWLGNAKDLIVSGTATVNETIGCRDDIMIYLIGKGFQPKRAFKIMESVRKGRGLPDGAEDEMKEHGVPEWYIGSCKKIAYLFPKAHAVAYVMMGFRIAWFKVHDPLAFYAAYFSIRAKAFDEKFMCRGMDAVKAKINEINMKKNAREKKDRPTAVEEDMLVTLEVCYEFYLRGFSFTSMDVRRSHAVRFLIDRDANALIPPFTSIAGLGETVGWDIMENREGQDFISIEEFSLVCRKASGTHLAQLKEAGAFGNLPDSSQVSFF